MLSYISSFIWDEPEDITPSERQVHLRFLLHKQIVLNNMTLKAVDAKPSISDGLIEYELNRLNHAKTIPIKRKKRKLFQSKK